MNAFSPACRFALVAVCLFMPEACKPSESPPPATASTKKIVAYDMRGVIERMGTESAPRQLVIRHEATHDMESMAMPFFIDDDVSLAGLAVGDKVSFHFEVDLNGGVERVTKLEKLPAEIELKIRGAATTPAAAPSATIKNMPQM